MRKILLVVVLLLVMGGLLWEFVPILKTDWIGGFDLTIHVSGSTERLQAVHCYVFGRRDEAEECATRIMEYHIPPEPQIRFAAADPFEGEPLTVNVPTSGIDSPLGRTVHYFQYRYLLVVARWEDGRRTGKVVEIPDGRTSREVYVALAEGHEP